MKRPADADYYLTQIYGDWRTPEGNFDTTISAKKIWSDFPISPSALVMIE